MIPSETQNGKIMKTLKVIDHKKFSSFEYQSFESTAYQLGDVVFKYPDILCDEQPQIGVIIQTHSDCEFRTDMWGNSSDAEISPATFDQIQKFRPDILDQIQTDYTLIEFRPDGWGYIVSKPSNKSELESIQNQSTPKPGYHFEIIPVSIALQNQKLIGKEYLEKSN
jgi:hypothetical protein